MSSFITRGYGLRCCKAWGILCWRFFRFDRSSASIASVNEDVSTKMLMKGREHSDQNRVNNNCPADPIMRETHADSRYGGERTSVPGRMS